MTIGRGGFVNIVDIILLNYWRKILKTLAKLHSFLFPHSHNTFLSFAGKPRSDLSTVGYTVQTSLLSDIKDVIGVHRCGLGGSMRAGFDPRSGQVSWVRFFSGFFLTCKANVGKF